MTKYAIGLGGNLGNRLGNLRLGITGIRELGSVERISNLYETAPVGGPEQPPYLNAVLVLGSDLDPHELLSGLNTIEAEAGRERKERWGARTLDLDLLVMSEGSVDTTDLVVPHPRASEREFVLRPLVDVWPDAPVGPDLDARGALERLEPQGVEEVSIRWVEDRKPRLGMLFVTIQFVWFLGVALALAWDGTLPEGSGDVFRIGGAVMAFIGGGMAFVSLRRLGDSLTALPEPKADGTLIEHGPYRYARHPIYGGVSLFLIGTALIVDSLLGTLLSLGLLPFFYMKSTYEERQLRIIYPGYRAYRERVSRRLIPFII